MKLFFLTAIAIVGAFGALACGGDDSSSMPMDGGSGKNMTVDPAAVQVMLSNWAVTPAQSALTAGKVTFQAMHQMDHGMNASAEGGATHELIVAAEETPGSGSFSKILLKLTEIKPGESKTGSVELKPGTYELSCQVGEVVQGKAVSHYAKGMHTTVTVK